MKNSGDPDKYEVLKYVKLGAHNIPIEQDLNFYRYLAWMKRTISERTGKENYPSAEMKRLIISRYTKEGPRVECMLNGIKSFCLENSNCIDKSTLVAEDSKKRNLNIVAS